MKHDLELALTTRVDGVPVVLARVLDHDVLRRILRVAIQAAERQARAAGQIDRMDLLTGIDPCGLVM